MRPVKYAIVSAVLAVSTQAPAEAPQQRQVTTTADLIELCGAQGAADEFRDHPGVLRSRKDDF